MMCSLKSYYDRLTSYKQNVKLQPAVQRLVTIYICRLYLEPHTLGYLYLYYIIKFIYLYLYYITLFIYLYLFGAAHLDNNKTSHTCSRQSTKCLKLVYG